MAFLGSLLAAATKAGVVAAGVALTVSGVGAAAVTGNLPEDVQIQVDELGTDDADEGVGSDLSEAVTNVDPELEGRERGEAVSDAARTANGSSDQGQADERREEAADRAEAGQANAVEGDDAADAADERRAEAEAKAAEGQANAVEGDDGADAAPDDADDARQDGDRRPEGAGAPETDS